MRWSHVVAAAAVFSSLVLSQHGLAVGAPDPATRSSPQAAAKNGDPRALVDSLYTVAGKLPIRDLVVELDSSDASGDTGNLVPSGKDKIYYKFPNKLRVDSVIRDPGGPLDGIQSIIIRDGTNCWHYVSMGQYPVKKQPDTPSATLALPFNIQRYPEDGARKYEMAGSETVDGVRTDVVRITNPNSPQDVRTVYIDRNRNVPLRLELQQPGEKGGPAVTTRVDYKDVRKLEDGRYFPFSIEVHEGSVLQKVRVYKGVKVNVGLQDNLFEPMSRFVR